MTRKKLRHSWLDERHRAEAAAAAAVVLKSRTPSSIDSPNGPPRRLTVVSVCNFARGEVIILPAVSATPDNAHIDPRGVSRDRAGIEPRPTITTRQ